MKHIKYYTVESIEIILGYLFKLNESVFNLSGLVKEKNVLIRNMNFI